MKQYTQYVYRDNAWRAVGSIPILPDGVYHINISGSGSIWEPDKCAALWYTTVNDSRISSLTDGLSISLKIPSVDEGGELGVLLNINSLGYHPVVYDVNTSIGDRYSVGSTIILTYNASQTATAYYNSSTATTYTGCWQINDAGSGDEALATSYSHGTVSGEAQWDDTNDQLFFSVEDSNTNDSNGLTIATNGASLYSNGASVWVDKYGQITLSSGLDLPSLVLNDTDGVFISKLKAPTENEHPATKKYVDDSITALPEPMIFKGSLGTGGTITSLPTASSSNEGFTYKVITAGTYASQAAKVGDTFISDGSAWVLIPSGDEPSGTVTSITIDATSPISIDSNSAITTSGSRTISHATSGVTAGTYTSVTVNNTGHITAGTSPTTLAGYGITDANISSQTITLGSNSVTVPTKTSELNNDANFMSGMTILKYGSSTWQDFLTAYTNKHVVYCRASSNSNPASGSQTRMAFMAYVNNETNPTEVEFQYYRSVSSHSDNQQGDQVYVYKLTSSNGGTWSVTVRECYTKVVGGANITGTWSNGAITLDHDNSGVTAGTYKSVTVDAQGHVTAGTNPTTLSGYGITDAKINNGVITLGSNTITPLTSSSTLDATKLSGTIPSGCYTDNDTKNTAGTTNTTSKIYLAGATSQATNPQTYSNVNCYASGGKLYSNAKEVVTLSDTQALTNKTYNGYTLAAASAKAVDTSISAASTSTDLPTSQAVASFVEGKGYTTNTGTITGVSVNGTSIATSGTANITSIPTSILSGVDTSITSGSTSTSIPTTAAVATYVDNHTVTVENASSTVVGGLKVRLDDSTHTLYITNNGQDA